MSQTQKKPENYKLNKNDTRKWRKVEPPKNVKMGRAEATKEDMMKKKDTGSLGKMNKEPQKVPDVPKINKPKDVGLEKLREFKDQVSDKLKSSEDIKSFEEQLKEKGDEIKKTAYDNKPFGEKISDTMNNIKEKVSDKVQSGLSAFTPEKMSFEDELKQAAFDRKPLGEKISDTVTDIKEKVSDNVQSGLSKAKEMFNVNEAPEKMRFEDELKKVANDRKPLGEKISDKITNFTEKVSDTVQSGLSKAKDAFTVEETPTQKSFGVEIKQAAFDRKPLGEKISETITNFTEKATEKVSDTVQSGLSKAKDIFTVEETPTQKSFEEQLREKGSEIMQNAYHKKPLGEKISETITNFTEKVFTVEPPEETPQKSFEEQLREKGDEIKQAAYEKKPLGEKISDTVSLITEKIKEVLHVEPSEPLIQTPVRKTLAEQLQEKGDEIRQRAFEKKPLGEKITETVSNITEKISETVQSGIDKAKEVLHVGEIENDDKM